MSGLSASIGNRAVGRLLARARTATLARCKYCGDHACLHGEKCGGEASLEGLFTPGIAPRATGPHKETRKSSKRGQYESEHMIPSAAWKQSGLPHKYTELPTMSIPYDTHRGAVSGGGGGVTSTGSGGVAQGWAQELGNLMSSGNMKEAVRKSAMDEYNAAGKNISQETVFQIMQVVNQHASRKDITQQEAADINTALMNRWLNDQKQF